MNNVLLSALLSAAVFAEAKEPASPVRATGGAAFRAGTYNIRCSTGDRGTPNAWDERKGDFVPFIRSLDMDVFGLQEVCPDQLEFLKEALPEYSCTGEFRNKNRKSGEASPVFFRKDRFEAERTGTFWLSETPDAPGSKSWDSALPRICSYAILKDKITGKRFCFANTHTDHIGLVAKERGMMLILDRMEKFGEGLPVVFTGDHNCCEAEAPAKAVSARLVNALYASKTAPAGSWRTDNNWRWRENEVPATEALSMPERERNVVILRPNGRFDDDGALANPFFNRCGGRRIDFIYVSPGVAVSDYATHNDTRPGTKLYYSDHFPVTATVVLP